MRLGTAEALLILAVVMLLFGPKQLPKVTEALRESMESIRRSREQDAGE